MSALIAIEKKLKIKKKNRRNKPLMIFLLACSVMLMVLLGVGIYAFVIPAQRVYAAAQDIIDTARTVASDIEKKDLSSLDAHLNTVQADLAKINQEIENYKFLKDIEATKGYYDNLQVVQELALKTQSLLRTAVPELKVLFKALGYKVETDAASAESTEADATDTTKDEELQAVISEMPRVIRLYDTLEPQLIDLMSTVNKIDPAYIPSIGGSTRERILQLQDLAKDFPTLSAQLKQTLSAVPSLLGADKPTKYLIVFQNEKELRSSGGLLSAFGHLTIDRGKLSDEIKVTDMWALEGYVSWTLGIDVGYRNIYGQNYLMNFPNAECGSTYLRAQDAGIYPDLYLTMDMFEDYYAVANRYNKRQYPDYDHILIINTFFASDLISLVEPLEVPGGEEPLTAENAAKLIFAETSSQPFDPAIRKSFIGEVATAMKDRFNEMSSQDILRVGQMLIRTIQAKNIAFFSKDKAIQAYFDNLGLSGRIEQNFAGDYFHLNEAQNCSLKSNFYVRDEVTQDVYIDDKGKINKDVNVKWWNDKLYDPKEEYIISRTGRFPYRAWVRIVTPKGTDITASDGLRASGVFRYRPQEYFDQKLQKQISDNIIYFDQRRLRESDPQRSQTLKVSYTLPEAIKYSLEGGYRMLIQKHPGKKDEKYTINIHQGGLTTTVEFVLDRDKVLTYRGGVVAVENYDTRLDEYFDILEKLKSI